VTAGERDFKLVSMYESMRVRGAGVADEVLAVVLPRLEEGSSVEDLVLAAGPSNHDAVRTIVEELGQRGMLVQERPGDTPGKREAQLYSAQESFFSNFRPMGEAPPGAPFALADKAADIQRNLTQSTVLLIGLGRIGSRVAKGLAHVGIGRLWATDPAPVGHDDCIDGAYAGSAVGQSREDAVGEIVRESNSFVVYEQLDAAALLSENPRLPGAVDLIVLCDDGFDPERHRAVNRLCLQRGIRWTSCRNLGYRVEVGPLVVPHETACFNCFEMRKASNAESYGAFLAVRERLTERGAGLGALNITLGYEVLALEVVKSLSGFSPPSTYASVWSFDPVTLRSQLHPVLKVPRCPVCRGSARNAPSMAIWDLGQLFSTPPAR